MKKYLAFDAINGNYEEFETIEEARKQLEESFSCDGEYHPDLKECKIYKLEEVVDYDIIDKKSNYKYVNEDDIPEDDTESKAWPYNSVYDEVIDHKFVKVHH